jgi:hypothetical protein
MATGKVRTSRVITLGVLAGILLAIFAVITWQTRIVQEDVAMEQPATAVSPKATQTAPPEPAPPNILAGSNTSPTAVAPNVSIEVPRLPPVATAPPASSVPPIPTFPTSGVAVPPSASPIVAPSVPAIQIPAGIPTSPASKPDIPAPTLSPSNQLPGFLLPCRH